MPPTPPPPPLSWVIAAVAKRWAPDGQPHLNSAFGYTVGVMIFMVSAKEYARALARANEVKR